MSSKYQTISELEQGDPKDPIWALNGSGESELAQPGDVHVGIPKINGSKIDNLHLAQTWLPICLTDQIPRAQLLAASEFRNAVNNKLLILVTPEFAKEVLNQDGADEEVERLQEMKRHVREATAHRSIADSGAEVISTQEISDPKETVASTELDPGFIMFTNNLETKSDIEALNLIRGRGKFSGRELKHLLKELHDKPKVKEFIKSKLSK